MTAFYEKAQTAYQSYPVINALGFQFLWLAGVLFGNQGLPLIALLLLLHFGLLRAAIGQLIVTLVGAIPGILLDAALSFYGVFEFSAHPGEFFVPLWLIGLWLGFVATLGLGYRFIFTMPKIAVLVGAIAGPVSYFLGAKLDAVTFVIGTYETLILLFLCWLALMVFWVSGFRYLSQKSNFASDHIN